MNKKGLTLIEIIISIAILSIVFVMFLSIFANQHGLIKRSSENTSDLITNQRLIERELSQQVVGADHQVQFTFGIVNFEVDGVINVEETFTNFLPGVDDTVVSVQSVSLPIGPIEITELGETEYLPFSIFPESSSNQEVTWSSNPEGIIEVEFGVIRALSEGTTILTVTTDDGGHTDTISVTVTDNISSGDAELTSFEYTSNGTDYSVPVTGASNYDLTVPDNQPPEISATINDPGPDDSVSIEQAKNYTQNVATVRITIDGTTDIFTVTFTKGGS